MGGFIFGAVALLSFTLLSLLRPWRLAGAHAPAPSGRTGLALAVALPLLATGLYAWLGTPAGIGREAAPPAALESAAHGTDGGDFERSVARLAERLQREPQDLQGWAMLARSYHAMGKPAQAQAAFERMGDAVQKDAGLLAVYADVLAVQAGRIEGKPLQMAEAALKLDPDQPIALAMAGNAAFQRKDFAQATRHWQRLLPQLPPDSDDARDIRRVLQDMGAAPPAPTTAAAAAEPGVSGTLGIAPALKAQVSPDDTVFVVARPDDGSRMPIAVQRAKVSDLPLAFRLDDRNAMSPERKVSQAGHLRVEARVSRSGSAMPGPGDLLSAEQRVAVGAGEVALTLDRVRP